MARVILTAGLNYGDEGKGGTVDFLARHHNAYLVVRYNGGCQAAHNVVERDGARHHTFSQFGSGTFAGAKTLLSRFMIVNPIALFHEAREGLEKDGLKDPLSLVVVERDAMVSTPFHVSANRIREMLRTKRHGSCGMGVGETMKDFVEGHESLFVRDLQTDTKTLTGKLRRIQERKRNEMEPLLEALRDEPSTSDRMKAVGAEYAMLMVSEAIERSVAFYSEFIKLVRVVDERLLEMLLESNGTFLFEGAQGVLLDQDFGFQPYTTWTDCTFGNALKLLEGWSGGEGITKLGIVRAYMTRHGAGPFVTEDPAFDVCSAKDHNKLGEWQGAFRSGAFDIPATRYALKVIGGVDGLVMNHLDRMGPLVTPEGTIPACWAYDPQEDPPYVTRPVNLEAQERLTERLFKVTPKYRQYRGTGNDYAWSIADALGVPLHLTSYGPTADDRRIVTGSSPWPV